ncbi:hypothetical protein [Nitrosomonas ureae]|uniref:Uncharacterized protein n=1 Tax=Nitrosomonas ureae TaxID=44577 RepID=A0A1H2FNE9_9PROT|nr:hypothetical protein [Nitrosomonas ureae]ALQ50057.1 hypothetical protein ATY38_01645 [Nitrosomonas ureae]SDU08860.1 hypothetical protein SAMN05216406_1238 [Nitrosomonas ureae]
MFQKNNFIRMWTYMIGVVCLLANGLALAQSDRSSVILENEAVQRSIDSRIGNNPSGSDPNDSTGLPAPGRPFNPPGINAPQPSGFNIDRPTSLHSPNPSAFNPGSPSGANQVYP